MCKDKDVYIFDKDKKPFYVRKNVKGVFNLPKGIYYSNNSLKLTRPRNYEVLSLPKKERKRSPSSFTVVFEDNPNKCQINTFTSEIFIDRNFWKSLNRCEQRAVIYHELGHYYYSTETFCDLYAVRRLLREGFNPSQIAMAFLSTLDNLRNKHRQTNIFKKYLRNANK